MPATGKEDVKSTLASKNDEKYRESDDEDYKDEGDADYGSDGESSDDAEYEDDNKESSSTLKKSSKTKKSRKVSRVTDDDEKIDYGKYSTIQGEGLIKTRSQRQVELSKGREFETSQAANSTFDVDSVWASMKSESIPSSIDRRGSSTSVATPSSDSGDNPNRDSSAELKSDSSGVNTPVATDDRKSTLRLQEEYITIKKTYKFAGKVETEEKRVLKTSDEAIAYLKEQESQSTETPEPDTDSSTSMKRKNSVSSTRRRGPVKRKQGSLLDELNSLKPKKLNTLEKSKMDWLGYVDQEGIKDELNLHNKDGYLKKQDFLSRVDSRIENNIRSNARRP